MKMPFMQPGMYQAPPFFYPQGMPAQRMVYPAAAPGGAGGVPQQRMRQWPPQGPQGRGVPPMVPFNQYMGVPQQGNGQQGAPQGRGPQRGRGRGGPQNKGVRMNVPPQQGGRGQRNPSAAYNYTNQARNKPTPQGMPQTQVPLGVNHPLTIQELAAAPEEQQKKMIGDRLFPLISARESTHAAKITGMLLDMDLGELLHLLESPDALNEKIQEALDVLKGAGNDQNTNADDNADEEEEEEEEQQDADE